MAQGHKSVPVNELVVGSIPTRGDEIFIYIYIFIQIGGKCGTECLNTRFPLPTLLCAGEAENKEKKVIDMPLYAVHIMNLSLSTTTHISNIKLKIKIAICQFITLLATLSLHL